VRYHPDLEPHQVPTFRRATPPNFEVISAPLLHFNIHVPVLVLLVCPEAIACGAGLSFTRDVLFATRDLRDARADRREILHDGQY